MCTLLPHGIKGGSKAIRYVASNILYLLSLTSAHAMDACVGLGHKHTNAVKLQHKPTFVAVPQYYNHGVPYECQEVAC